MSKMRFTLFATLWIAGCATAPLSEDDQRDADVLIESVSGELEHAAGARRAPPVADEQIDLAPENAAVAYLLDSAEIASNQREFAKAEALVERALRIQRTAVRAYRVAATIQVQQGNSIKAENLARQGMVYAVDGSEEALNLRKILDGRDI